MPKSIELERRKSKKERNDKSTVYKMTRVYYVKCRRKNAIVRKVSEQKRRRILCLKYKVGRKKEW